MTIELGPTDAALVVREGADCPKLIIPSRPDDAPTPEHVMMLSFCLMLWYDQTLCEAAEHKFYEVQRGRTEN